MVLLSISFILSCLACFNNGGKEEADLFETKFYRKRGGQLVQETSTDSTLQSVLPNVCSICFIHSLHFSVRV